MPLPVWCFVVSYLPSVNVMTKVNQTTIPSSTFISIFDAALEEYKNKTGQDLRTHPFAAQLDSCKSADAILATFQKQVDSLNRAKKKSQTLMKWLNTIVPVLVMFSGILGEGFSLVCLGG
jgi:fungal STAND N-terminal Goodbye domain